MLPYSSKIQHRSVTKNFNSKEVGMLYRILQISFFLAAVAIFTAASSQKALATDIDTKIAASFAAKYDICSKKIKKAKLGLAWNIKAGVAKERADDLNKERLLEQGYIKSFEKEKKKIKRNWNLKRCKKFVNEHLDA
jgi:uncharacterized metal-binding protein